MTAPTSLDPCYYGAVLETCKTPHFAACPGLMGWSAGDEESGMTTPSAESALIIAVPEAEPLVKPFRERFDPSASAGVPAHITILYPFKPPHEITPAVQVELHRFFTQFPAFEFTLGELRRFPEVLYLAPSPDDRFRSLMGAVYRRYPGTPPYGGAFSEVIPHLTIAEAEQPVQLDVIEGEFMELHGAQLPVKAHAQEVLLIDNTSGRWEVRQTFRLSARGRPRAASGVS